MLSKITDMLTYFGCCLIDMSSCFHQNIHHLSVSLLTGSVEWTETILYSERQLMRHSWLTSDHSSPSLDTRRPDNHLSQVSSSSNLHKSIVYTSHYRLTVKTSHIRESVDSLYRDDTDEISRDPRTKRLKTRWESLPRPSKHTSNSLRAHIYLYMFQKTSYAPSVLHARLRSYAISRFSCHHILHLLLLLL